MKRFKKGIAGILSLAIVAGLSGSAFASDLLKVVGGIAALSALTSVSTKTDTFENLQKTVNYYVYLQEKDSTTSYEWKKQREIRASLRSEYKHLPARIQNLGMFLCDVRNFDRDGKYCYIPLADVKTICSAAEYALRGYIPDLYTDDKGVVRDKNNNNEVFDTNSLEYRDSYVNPDNIAKIERISIFPFDCIQQGSMSHLDQAKITFCLKKLQAVGQISNETVEPFVAYCERYGGSDIFKQAEEALKNPQQ